MTPRTAPGGLRARAILVLLLAGLATTSCMTMTTVQSVPGKAYVVHGHLFGTDVYSCTAKASQAVVCRKVVEVPR